MKKHVKKWSVFALRWGIAAVGVVLVVRNIAFRDRVLVLDGSTNKLVARTVLGDARDTDATFTILVPATNGPPAEKQVGRGELWAKAEKTGVEAVMPGGAVHVAKVLGVQPNFANPKAGPANFFVEDTDSHENAVVNPSQVRNLNQYLASYIPYPLVEVGLNRMVRQAKVPYLIAALAVIPMALLLTTIRWHLLLEAVGIRIGTGRTFAINMVGLFYNTFLPGSTGGDLVKAWHASKHTTHRTWAVISVLMDRAIGLLALVIVGGTMSACQWNVPDCRKVAIISGLVLLATAAGLTVFYVPALRRLTGLDFLLRRMPMQRLVRTAVQGLEMYGHDHPKKTLLALLLCFPVHVTTVVSATLAGNAFGLTMPLAYYWVAVPVIALVGAIPISPQGAGVMEGFAILLTRSQGVTISQAVALTLSIRLVQIFWNLIAGIFVLRGDYHAPTDKEQHELEEEEPEVIATNHPMPVEI